MSPKSSSTTPDPFDVGAILTAIESDACPTGHAAYISIPQLSPDGILPIAVVPTGLQHYQDRVCGNDFGIEGGVAGPLVCELNIFYQHFHWCFSTFQLVNNLSLWVFGPRQGQHSLQQRDLVWTTLR